MQSIDTALFEAADGASGPVRLPDTWSQRGVGVPATGRYRLHFDLREVRDESLALMFTRLSTHHRVHVNGTLASGGAEQPRGSNLGSAAPALIGVPPALLRPGRNEVVVEVHHRQRAGLSTVEWGSLSLMQERFQRHVLLGIELPRAMNMACGGLALLLILIWWKRRSEVALGSFGLLALLGSARNYGYFAPVAVGSAQAWDWAFFAVQACTLLLLSVFAQAFAKQRWPRYTRALVWFVIGVSLVGFVAMTQGQLQALRGWVYPPMLAACLPALWLCVRRARAQPVWSVLLRSLGVIAMLVAVAHDYAFQTASYLPITANYWQPYVMPVALGAMSLVLVRRMVNAMSEVEQLNAELEARVAERTHDLELANAAKTRFLASASHDLRQPLVTIGLLVGLAREGSESPPMRRIIDRVDSAVGAMERLLTGLLDLSRLEAGAVRPRRMPVPLAALFQSIEAHEQAAAALKGLRLRFRATDAVVHSDPVMLEGIVRNLVANAIRYTDRGSVLVAARRARGALRLEVRDSGVGIAPEHQAEIFEEFVQLGNPAREGARGMGLGLAIVQRSAAMLGHRLGLRSAAGCGSCFWVELPLSTHAPGAPPPVREAPGMRGRRVLLVEDETAVREALCERLRAWGAQVEGFAGLPALRRWLAQAQEAPDLVVSDYRLPEGDGLQVLAEVRQRFGAVPAVLVTGDTAPQDIARLHGAGVRVLHKPFRPEALLEALASRRTG